MVENQRGGAMTFAVEPLKLCVEAVPGRPEEVHLRVVKRHSFRDVAVRLRQRGHQPGEERGVRNLIDHGWTRGQGAILDSQVCDAISYSVARPVPTPHSAVVQPQG